MTDITYNGWSNYETWCWNLWLDNAAAASDYMHVTVKQFYDEATHDETFTQAEAASLALSEWLKEQAEERAPKLKGVFGDLLTHAIGMVDFYEIAKAWIDEVILEEGE